VLAVQMNDNGLLIFLGVVGVLLTPALAVFFLMVLRRKD
jgi:hypothetical protein